MKAAVRFSLMLVAVAVVTLLAACSGDNATSTPLTPDTSSMTSMAGATQDSRNNGVYFVCHQNPDGDDLDPDWVVVGVDYRSRNKHCSRHADDFTSDGYGACNTCDLSGFLVGDDCSICAVY